MKKIYFASVALVAAALTSCIQEQSFNDVKLGENDVVFTFQGAAPTKAAEAPARNSGVTLSLGNEDGGDLVLEETVVDLNAWSPATKGTPAYTENVGDLYKNDLNVYATEFGGDALFETMDEEIYEYKNKANVNTAGWRYRHTYDADYWPKDGSAVDFYLQMPATQPGVTMTSRTGGAFSFSYASMAKAEEQKDILFAYRSLTKEEHNSYLPAGAPVLFHHALTGVKFRIQNSEDERESKSIKISRIEFIGLKNTGNCVVTPRKEKENNQETDYVDNRDGDYSSGDQTLTTGTVKWTGTTANPVKNTIYQDFNGSDIHDFDADEDPNNFAPSFYEAGNTQNLNKADASFTFWMIPQSFSGSEAELRISYEIYDKLEGVVKPHEATIELGEALANVTWKAGELRTYTLKVNDIGVDITDEITVGQKENVSFSNTGNTPEYIRVKIVANWVDSDNLPFVGYTYGTERRNVAEEGAEAEWKYVVVDGPNGNVVSPANDTFVTPWTLTLNPNEVSYTISGKTYAGGANTTYADAQSLGENGKYGVFSGLPGANWDWTTKGDGYIYYTKSIAVGASGRAATTELFKKFKLDPYTRYSYKVKDPMTGEREAVEIHLQMDIMVQSIEAKEGEDWSVAWTNAMNTQNG